MLHKANEKSRLINPIIIHNENEYDSDSVYKSDEIRKSYGHSSLITIFSIWNTMMGTSILSMPWAIQQAGFGFGIFLLLFVGSISLYTAIIVLKSTKHIHHSRHSILDFTDACKFYLGKTGEILSIIFSIITLLSGLIVYYILLCNFLYRTVLYIFNYATYYSMIGMITNSTNINSQCLPSGNTSSYLGNISNGYASYSTINDSTMKLFNLFWSENLTVPFWLLVIVLPLILIRSTWFVSRFNALGTISVVYLIFLSILKVVQSGVHLDFSKKQDHVLNFGSHFTVLTGIATLAFFIHNSIHHIMSHQSNQENNIRDLSIAYLFVVLTYILIGSMFYVGYPFNKECIQDNFLNNFSVNDPLAVVGRMVLFFQILTVIPLLVTILRTQFFYYLFKIPYSKGIVNFIFHIILMKICILFAIFIPRIGDVARFSGSICGFIYIFSLPALVKIEQMRRESSLTILSLIFHSGLIVIGIANLIGQFLPFFY